MFSQFFIIFALMAIGYSCCKKGWLNKASIAGIGNILINVSVPALMLSGIFGLNIGADIMVEFVTMSMLSIGVFMLFSILAAIYVRLRDIPVNAKGVIQLFLLSTNNGFIGLPIAVTFFGQKGLFLMIANNLVMNIILFSYGVVLLKKKAEKVTETRYPQLLYLRLKQIMNPCVFSIILGLTLGIFGLTQYVPEPIKLLLESIGNLAMPLSMMYIGSMLYGSKLPRLLHDRLVVEACIVRSTILPLITYIFLIMFNISAMMSQIIFLATMLPCAAIIPILAAEDGNVIEESSKLVLLSTLISLITMPIGVFLASNIF
ncbi:MAG TPA: AEC family transporter [Clostridia bacterium]|nr:AEC family transporter [Clostridia bacterium]